MLALPRRASRALVTVASAYVLLLPTPGHAGPGAGVIFDSGVDPKTGRKLALDEMAVSHTPADENPVRVDVARRFLQTDSFFGYFPVPYATVDLPSDIDAARLAAAIQALPETATIVVDRSAGKERPGIVGAGGGGNLHRTVDVPVADLYVTAGKGLALVPLRSFYAKLAEATPLAALDALSTPVPPLQVAPPTVDLSTIELQVALYPRPGDSEKASKFRYHKITVSFANATTLALRGSDDDYDWPFEATIACGSAADAMLAAQALAGWSKATPGGATLFLDHGDRRNVPMIIPAVPRRLTDVYVSTGDARFADLKQLVEASERTPIEAVAASPSTVGFGLIERCKRSARAALEAVMGAKG